MRQEFGLGGHEPFHYGVVAASRGADVLAVLLDKLFGQMATGCRLPIA